VLDDIDIIDPHHHFWDLSRAAYPWLQGPADPQRFSGDDSAIRRNYLPDDYRADFAPLRLVGSVHVEAGADDGLAEARWLQKLEGRSGLPSAIVAGADLSSPDAPARIEELSEQPMVRGVRHILNWHPDPRYAYTDRNDLMRDPRWLENFGRLSTLGLSFDLQIYPGQMPEAAVLADLHPSTNIVLNHTGMPLSPDPEAFALWRDGMKALALRPNVTVKISGLGMTHHDWTRESIRPYVLETIEAFGPQRAMFASNFPVDRLYSSLTDLYAAFDELTQDLPDADRRALFADTARTVYRIPRASQPGSPIAQASPAQALAVLHDSSALLGDRAALLTRAQRDGYLFFRGLLPRQSVLEVRHDVLSQLDAHGWIQKGTRLDDGIIDEAAINEVPEDELRADIGISAQGYTDVQRVHSMHRLPHHPALMALYRTLFAEDVFVHPRHIVRVMTSHRALVPTPAHQDFPLVQGSQTTWTAWFPLGDCPLELGPLVILRGSHMNGYLSVRQAAGAGGLSAQLCDGETDWAGGDFAAGDVLTFPSLTVHKALAPLTKRRVRLSMDVRYQPASEPIEAKSLTNHAGVDWDDIYLGWDTEDLQYYWNGTTPRLSPWDDSLLQPGRRIC
jgi:predicted TIM-barrel fold metal-dependent hydrolase